MTNNRKNVSSSVSRSIVPLSNRSDSNEFEKLIESYLRICDLLPINLSFPFDFRSRLIRSRLSLLLSSFILRELAAIQKRESQGLSRTNDYHDHNATIESSENDSRIESFYIYLERINAISMIVERHSICIRIVSVRRDVHLSG